jgi:hypothetical protein
MNISSGISKIDGENNLLNKVAIKLFYLDEAIINYALLGCLF